MLQISVFCAGKGFCTPESLKLHDTEPKSYATICSRLVYLVANKLYKRATKKELKKDLISIEFYKDLDQSELPSSKRALKIVKNANSKKLRLVKKPSVGKLLLIEVLLTSFTLEIRNTVLMKLYNSLVAPMIKKMNAKRVKGITRSA